MSGNYRVSIYDDNGGEDPVIRAYFMVCENAVRTQMKVRSDTLRLKISNPISTFNYSLKVERLLEIPMSIGPLVWVRPTFELYVL